MGVKLVSVNVLGYIHHPFRLPDKSLYALEINETSCLNSINYEPIQLFVMAFLRVNGPCGYRTERDGSGATRCLVSQSLKISVPLMSSDCWGHADLTDSSVGNTCTLLIR